MRWTGMGMAIFNGMAALLLLAFSGGGEEPDTATPSAPEAKPTASAPPAPHPHTEVIDEIREIRRRLGIDPLAGSSLIAPADAAQDQQHAANGSGHIDDPAGKRDEQFTESLRKYIPSLVAARAQGDVVFQRPAPAAESPFVGTLRATCRELVLRAEDLEQQRQYNEADRLRCMAQQLRLEARRAEQAVTLPR